MDRAERMGTERMGRLVATLSLPVIVGMVAGSLYNLADRVFVGRGVGEAALAGLTLTLPFFILVYAVGLLFGIGGAAAISLALGRGERKEAERVAGTAVAAGSIAGALVILLLYLALEPLLLAFGGTGEVLVAARHFCRIFLAGSFFQVLAILLGSVLRAQGEPAPVLASSLAGIALNLVLNPLFIFALKLGVAGSALATSCGSLLSFAWLALLLARGRGSLALKRSNLLPERRAFRQIVAIGVSPFFVQLALCLMMGLSNAVAARQGGQAAIAVMGIIYVIYPLILQPLAGLSAGVQPILGYNYGAGKAERVSSCFRIATGAGTALCIAAWLLIMALPGPLVALFVGGAPEVSALGPRSLRIFFALLPLVGLQTIGSGYFQAVGKAGLSLLNNLLRQLILIVPLLLVLTRFFGLDGLWLANPVSDLLAAAITAAFLALEFRAKPAPGWQGAS
jgi:putative MATE family efflux protein